MATSVELVFVYFCLFSILLWWLLAAHLGLICSHFEHGRSYVGGFVPLFSGFIPNCVLVSCFSFLVGNVDVFMHRGSPVYHCPFTRQTNYLQGTIIFGIIYGFTHITFTGFPYPCVWLAIHIVWCSPCAPVCAEFSPLTSQVQVMFTTVCFDPEAITRPWGRVRWGYCVSSLKVVVSSPEQRACNIKYRSS